MSTPSCQATLSGDGLLVMDGFQGCSGDTQDEDGCIATQLPQEEAQ